VKAVRGGGDHRLRAFALEEDQHTQEVEEGTTGSARSPWRRRRRRRWCGVEKGPHYSFTTLETLCGNASALQPWRSSSSSGLPNRTNPSWGGPPLPRRDPGPPHRSGRGLWTRAPPLASASPACVSRGPLNSRAPRRREL